ncbi:MAG: amidohydrolase family protein, partial [Planctomycetes bacterium]|nr:amidohydrolase family protein [Planctomycetota bacterium]
MQSSITASKGTAMRMPIASWLATLVVACVLPAAPGAEPDRIVHHGKIVTVDRAFSIQEAMAIQDGRVVRVGSNEEVLAAKGPKTEVVDLGGRMVLPGLIDSHMHPFSACMTEFDHAIPEMETIEDVLDYVRARAAVLQEGEWVTVRQVFITRLREQRYPTREELDRAAPKHPVIFATGPDAALNSLGLKQGGIDKNFTVDDGGPGYVEKDQQTGDPTGILRSCTRYVKVKSSGKGATDQDRLERILELFKDYNAVGLTTIGDRDADASEVDLYRRLAGRDDLTVRVSISHGVDTGGSVEEVKKRIRRVAEDSLFKRTGSTERGPSDGGPPVSHG